VLLKVRLLVAYVVFFRVWTAKIRQSNYRFHSLQARERAAEFELEPTRSSSTLVSVSSGSVTASIRLYN